VLSQIVLRVAVRARYRWQLRSASRLVCVITVALALYCNVFVLVEQSFGKVPASNAPAPTGKEPPFLVAQTLVLAVFVFVTVLAVKQFHPHGAGRSFPDASSQNRQKRGA